MDHEKDSKQNRDGEPVIVSEEPLEEGEVYGRRLSATEWAKYRQTKRGLTPRHVQLMAIGGSIGTALFVGIGGSLKNAGPLSLLLGYLFWGLLFIWPSYLLVAEMLAWLPVRGTIFELCGRYVDPALGFAMGWTYFFAGAMLVCTEYSSVATVMTYWNTSVNAAVWVTMALVVCVFFNLVAVRWYGESEFIMASTKILLIIGLILLTFITMVGGNPKHDAYGFRYWKHGMAMHPFYTTGATGRFLGFFSVVRYAAFTISGPDLISLAAGEIQNPRRTIPRVARLVFYRLVGFYVLGVLCVGIICSSRDARLISAINDGKAGAAASPWVVGIQNLGITGLPSFINALILLSGLSCGNAYLYSTSRTLYSLARDGQAPKFLMKCTKSGIPTYCVLVVTVISLITYLVASNSAVTVFFWFISICTITFILTYVGMLWTYIGWYRALKAQGIDRNSLPYKAPFAPYTAWLAIGIGCVVMLFIGFDCFVPWSTQGFVTSYFGLAYGVSMFVFWKVVKRTKWVDPKTCDIWSGKAEIDEECKEWEDGGFEEVEKARLAQMNIVRRTWERLW
ncbi:hypothetical protein G647_07020 [Cladophialophora carrionii CBS 160.54]|uniref:Amino acid permease/ SLC12A domain-containing protein n=1 Tax=Cladophialophora carrionii CBS 160.54 TaxID=1279043 RepID=V9D307_9EURO|nr:uncharacterized protein G647_07020 [Cladophialophora carrionii CBS 160.54]ETI20678.1 hypothetical protein G647_07020 [Cladophialophora carrionii CBS 160.54]